MSTTKYLIYTDLDGTLLDHHSYSYEAALPVLRALQKQGHIIIPNTSKTFAELNKFCQQIPLNSPFIVENGAAIYIPQGFLPKQPEETTRQNGYWCKSMTHTRNHWLALIKSEARQFQDCFVGFSDMSTEQIADLTSLTKENASLAAKRQYGEPLLWRGSKEQLANFEQVMTKAGATILKGGRFVHVCGLCDKGIALRWLTEQFHRLYPFKFTTVALGDSGNDTAMLEAADIAIQIKAPERAFPTINKKQHLYQSTLYGPEGWAETLSSLILQPSHGGD